MNGYVLLRMSRSRLVLLPVILLFALTVGLAGCGGGGDKDKGDTDALSADVQAACSGSALSEAPKLPASFPQIEEDKLTYTQQSTNGPTDVIEGYFHGDVKDAHDEFEKELKGAGYKILFNELEAPNDSEISWDGEGRTGQVALRNECGESDKHARPHHEPRRLARPLRSRPATGLRPGSFVRMSAGDRRARFRALHEREQLFVMPNPWDVGSARLLAGARVRGARDDERRVRLVASASTTSSVTRDELVAHVATLAAATTLPLNVDSERCFPDEPGGVAETVALLAEAGAAGFSIEDYDPAAGRIDDVGRRRRARRRRRGGAHALDEPLVLTGAGREPHPRRRRPRRHDRPAASRTAMRAPTSSTRPG